MCEEPGEPAGAAPPAEKSQSMVIEGCQVTYRRPYSKNKKAAGRFIVNECPRHGPLCTKSRSEALCVDRFGDVAAQLFIGRWLEKRFDFTTEAHCHRTNDPDEAEMEAYGRKHGLL